MSGRVASWPLWLSLWMLISGCTALTPEGARVAVYESPMDAPPAQRSMPEGCRRLAAGRKETTTELDLEGQNDPLRQYRNEAGAVGANALLVVKRRIVSRQDSECPTSSPITDCPPSFGAWFEVVIESYACSSEALDALSKLPPSAEREIGRIPPSEPATARP
jgi:hypothetical protein